MHYASGRVTSFITGIVTAVAFSLLGASPGLGASRTTTAFVPELATPTIEVRYAFHADEMDGFDLERTSVGARFSYVPYPALEGHLEFDMLSFDLEGKSETGLGVGAGLKYQVVGLFDAIDMAVAFQGSYGNLEKIDEYEAEAILLISRDISQGWTPYAGAGVNYGSQKFEGSASIPSVEEKKFSPVVFGGLKYMVANHLTLSLGTFMLDGLGLELSAGYRF